MAATAPIPAAARPAPAADDWAPAGCGPAAAPALPRHRPAAAAGPGRAEHCQAAAARDRKRYCRAARAPEVAPRASWRRSGPQTRSGQWFETSGTLKRIRLTTLYRRSEGRWSAARNAPVNTLNTAGKGRDASSFRDAPPELGFTRVR